MYLLWQIVVNDKTACCVHLKKSYFSTILNHKKKLMQTSTHHLVQGSSPHHVSIPSPTEPPEQQTH